jgi:hypothetical protein
MMVRSGSEVCLKRVGGRSGVAKVGRKWRNFGGAGSESHTAGGDPDENCFNIDANMDLGKNSSRFWGQKGNSDL